MEQASQSIKCNKCVVNDDGSKIINVEQDGDILLAPGDGKPQIRVSKKVMCLYSATFKTMLEGQFEEGHKAAQASSENPAIIPLPETDCCVLFWIVMIFYHRTSATTSPQWGEDEPAFIRLIHEMIVFRAVIRCIDFFQAEGACAPYVRFWLLSTHKTLQRQAEFVRKQREKSNYERCTEALQLCEAYIRLTQLCLMFEEKSLFEEVARDAMLIFVNNGHNEKMVKKWLVKNLQNQERAEMDEENLNIILALFQDHQLKLRRTLQADVLHAAKEEMFACKGGAVLSPHCKPELHLSEIDSIRAHPADPTKLDNFTKTCMYLFTVATGDFNLPAGSKYLRTIPEEIEVLLKMPLTAGPWIVELKDFQYRHMEKKYRLDYKTFAQQVEHGEWAKLKCSKPKPEAEGDAVMAQTAGTGSSSPATAGTATAGTATAGTQTAETIP